LGLSASTVRIKQSSSGLYRIVDSGCDPPSAQPTRVAVDETAVKRNDELSWLYAAIDLGTKSILAVDVFDRRGTDPAAAFLRELNEKHGLSEAAHEKSTRRSHQPHQRYYFGNETQLVNWAM
jgi:transposase-like protein